MNSGNLNVLILCEGNSCRSQMAEGWLRHLSEGRIGAYSAGSDPLGAVHPLALQAMAEVDIDIGAGRSKHMNDFLQQSFDYVITVCAPAAEACPTFPGPARRLHWPFDDPATAKGSDEQIMAAFRRLRDEIELQIENFLENIA